jgi:hypothetical protein
MWTLVLADEWLFGWSRGMWKVMAIIIIVIFILTRGKMTFKDDDNDEE